MNLEVNITFEAFIKKSDKDTLMNAIQMFQKKFPEMVNSSFYTESNIAEIVKSLELGQEAWFNSQDFCVAVFYIFLSSILPNRIFIAYADDLISMKNINWFIEQENEEAILFFELINGVKEMFNLNNPNVLKLNELESCETPIKSFYF
ncbi:TPA: hypothetical protein ACX6RM_002256 [Photobacterium damselae]